MANIFITEQGKIRKFEDIEAAEEIAKARAGKDPWIVIDKLLELWAKKSPDDVKAININVDEYRENQLDKKFGQTLGGKDFDRRFTISFPQQLMLMIRSQYSTEELPFNSAFYKEFANRYPFFKIAEKV